jgi:hypothetical protein
MRYSWLQAKLFYYVGQSRSRVGADHAAAGANHARAERCVLAGFDPWWPVLKTAVAEFEIGAILARIIDAALAGERDPIKLTEIGARGGEPDK